MKIGILYICTGVYSGFWPTFFKSAEKHFAQDSDQHYFVFTDSREIVPNYRVTVIPQDSLGWPFNTLYRYRMFLRIRDRLKDFDQLVFFNANCEFKSDVDATDFFGSDGGLVACIHPGFYDKSPDKFTYEKRPESTACVVDGKIYCQGALIGGSAKTFLSVCEQLHKSIEADLDNGLMAVWHDESHWNAFLNIEAPRHGIPVHLLDPSHLYPEGWSLPFPQRIVLRDKSAFIDVNKIKGIQNNLHTEIISTSFILNLLKRTTNFIKSILRKLTGR